MMISMEPTTKLVELNGVPARIWEGKTWEGVPVHVYVTRIMPVTEDEAQLEGFARELQEVRPPSPLADAIPLRLLL